MKIILESDAGFHDGTEEPNPDVNKALVVDLAYLDGFRLTWPAGRKLPRGEWRPREVLVDECDGACDGQPEQG